jgi:protein-S-isoprenylcysteine O-methyltransferase Ste14
MDIIERVLNILLTISIFLAGLFLAFAIPFGIHVSDFRLFPIEIGIFRFVGLIPIAFGVLFAIGGAWGFISVRTGSPMILDTPDELIIKGSYRFVRNPLYVGFCLILLGEAFLYESSGVLVYLVAFFFMFNVLVLFAEEPILIKKFGKRYEEYCKSVSRWIPRLTHFHVNIRKSS